MTRFLAKHTQTAAKVEGTKEWKRTTDIVDPAVEEYLAQHSEEMRIPAREDFLENNHIEVQESEY